MDIASNTPLDSDGRKELRDIFSIYKAYANHEDTLASHRFAWMMLANSALFTVFTYCLAMVNAAVASGDKEVSRTAVGLLLQE